MLGSTLALLTRSMKQDSRLLFPHLMRLGLLGFAIWMLYVAHDQSKYFGAPGLNFFQSTTWLNFVFISIAGVGIFSSAITEEKEERTVGLLRMAGINPVSLLLGKSLPRLINAILLLTLQFPFTLLAIALGGVTIHQVEAAYCSLLAFMLALGNVALLASVVCRTTNRASWLTGILLVFYLLAAPLADTALDSLKWMGWTGNSETFEYISDLISRAGQATSIWYRINQIMSTGFSDAIIGTQVISSLVVSVLSFGLAWALAGRFVRDDEMGGVGARFTFRRKGKVKQFPVGRAWTNALVWKDFHFLAGGIAGWWRSSSFMASRSWRLALHVWHVHDLGSYR
nr:hypothetical protein [uncultured bacterium]